jgi:hypothetical protein
MRFLIGGYFRATCLFALSSMGKLNAQMPGIDSSIRARAINNTISQYHAFFSPSSALYNGPQYVEYSHTLQSGHPFFQSPDLNIGSIVYDNILYEKVPFQFDLVKNTIVISNLSGEMKLALLNDKISSFSVLGHNFIRVVKDSVRKPIITTGFYDVLHKGRSLTLLKKENKKIREELNAHDGGVKRSIEDNADFFVEKNNMYNRVNSRSALLDLFKDNSSVTRQYIRQNKLKFRNDIEKDLVSVISFLDNLNK